MSFDIALNSHGGLQSVTKLARKHHKKGLPKVLLSILLLLSLTTFVGAQDGATTALPTGIDNKAPAAPDPTPAPAAPATPDPTPAAPAATDSNSTEPAAGDQKSADQIAEEEFLKSGKPRIKIESIAP